LSDRKLKPLPPDPVRHQDSAIAPHGDWIALLDSDCSRRVQVVKPLPRLNLTWRFFNSLLFSVSLRVTAASGEPIDLAEAINQMMANARRAHVAGNKLIFVGNGGSAAIASHMATDYSKNGDVRSLALNDSSMLTCLGNDLGYDRVFDKQVELHARRGDLVMAISSSGRSANILNAVKAARAVKCAVVTFNGFAADNPLRSLGDINFYIASDRYGFVEIGHPIVCHAILHFLRGLRFYSMLPAASTTA
jgi:D-sedoheptulose 7-phosphate isomerase